MLEMGFGEAATRSRYAKLAREAGLTVRLHRLDVDAEERWRRVQARNAARSATPQLSFEITREMFDFAETRREPPSIEEMAVYDGLRVQA